MEEAEASTAAKKLEGTVGQESLVSTLKQTGQKFNDMFDALREKTQSGAPAEDAR